MHLFETKRREEWGGWKGWGRWRARTTLNTSYSLRVDEPLQRAVQSAVRVRTCESRGMKIYHTVFITVDAIVGSNYVWRGPQRVRFSARRRFMRPPKERSKSSAVDQRYVSRSTAMPSEAPRCCYRWGWRATNASSSFQAVAKCTSEMLIILLQIFLYTSFRIIIWNPDYKELQFSRNKIQLLIN